MKGENNLKRVSPAGGFLASLPIEDLDGDP
jgi:hypothetical protein